MSVVKNLIKKSVLGLHTENFIRIKKKCKQISHSIMQKLNAYQKKQKNARTPHMDGDSFAKYAL
jgi:hypothetical protein